MPKLLGSIDVLAVLPDLASVSMRGTAVEGSVAAFTNHPSLTSLDMSKVPGVHGDVAALGGLNQLVCARLRKTGVSGSLRSFQVGRKGRWCGMGGHRLTYARAPPTPRDATSWRCWTLPRRPWVAMLPISR